MLNLQIGVEGPKNLTGISRDRCQFANQQGGARLPAVTVALQGYLKPPKALTGGRAQPRKTVEKNFVEPAFRNPFLLLELNGSYRSSKLHGAL